MVQQPVDTSPSVYEPASQHATTIARETVLAVKNAFLLAASLAGTLGVAVAVRIWMPRYLGPEAFGRLHFAEEIAGVCLFFTTLGVDTYIKKEVANQGTHASEFFGGVMQVRLLATLLVGVGMAGLLLAMGKTGIEWQLAYLFALGQAGFVFNTSLASCLQARGTVRELAMVNVACKALWGLGAVLGLAHGGGLLMVPLAFLVSELVKAPMLVVACRHHLGLRLHFNFRPALRVVGYSLPFYFNQLAHEVYGRIGVTVLSWHATDSEVGWFGAANHIKILVLLLLPIINAVVLPMSSRVARASEAMLETMMSATIRLALVLTTPVAVLLALNAGDIVRLLYSASYAPAAHSLRVLALLIPFACFCVLAAMHLLQLGRVWTVTKISLVALVINAVSTPLLIHIGRGMLPEGGAGVGAASASVLTEAAVALMLIWALGSTGMRQSVGTVTWRLAIVTAVTALAHVLLGSLGALRLVTDTLVWVVVGAAVGAMPLGEIVREGLSILRRKGRTPS